MPTSHLYTYYIHYLLHQGMYYIYLSSICRMDVFSHLLLVPNAVGTDAEEDTPIFSYVAVSLTNLINLI